MVCGFCNMLQAELKWYPSGSVSLTTLDKVALVQNVHEKQSLIWEAWF